MIQHKHTDVDACDLGISVCNSGENKGSYICICITS